MNLRCPSPYHDVSVRYAGIHKVVVLHLETTGGLCHLVEIRALQHSPSSRVVFRRYKADIIFNNCWKDVAARSETRDYHVHGK